MRRIREKRESKVSTEYRNSVRRLRYKARKQGFTLHEKRGEFMISDGAGLVVAGGHGGPEGYGLYFEDVEKFLANGEAK